MYRSNLFLVALFNLSVTVLFAQQVLPSQQTPPFQQPSSLANPLPWESPATASVYVISKPVPQEDWSVPELPAEALPPRLALVMATQETALFTRELVRFEVRPADPIDVYIIRPRGVEKPHVILNLYGYPSETDRFRNDGWCERATKDGFVAVGFVSALTGDRYHSRPMKEWFVSELQESLGETTHDVQRILDYLSSRGDFNMTDVAMYGQGSGATIAILAAHADPRITVLDLVNPWGDWPDWLKDSPQVPEVERPRFVKPEFIARVDHLEPMTYLPHLKLKGLRVQQVMDDIVTPPSARAKLASVIPSSALIVYPDSATQIKALGPGSVWGWLKETVQAPAGAAVAATDTAAH